MQRSDSRHGPLSTGTRLAGVFFFLLGSAAIVLGGHDLMLAAQLTFRIVGAAVVLVGVALLAAAVGFVLRRRWSYAYGVGSGVAAAVFAALFLVAQWVTGVHDIQRLILWVAVAVLSTAAAIAVAHEGRVRPGALARRRVQVASSLLSIGALLSIAQFWNGAVRVPPTSAPSMSITSQLSALPVRKGLRRVGVNVKIRNSGSTKVWVLGSLYEVWGGWATANTRPPPEYVALIEKRGSADQLRAGSGVERHTRGGWSRLIETGTLLEELTYLVPGEEYAFDLLVHVPPRLYDEVRFEALVVLAKDTLVLEETDVSKTVIVGGPRRLVERRTVRETSWIARLLRGRREVRIELVLDRKLHIRDPYLLVTIDRHGGNAEPDDEDALRMARLYGLAGADTWSELGLR